MAAAMIYVFPFSQKLCYHKSIQGEHKPNIEESGGTDHEKHIFRQAVQSADRLLQVVLHGLLTGTPKQIEGGICDEKAG